LANNHTVESSPFQDPPPWHDPVDLDALLTQMVDVTRRYVVVDVEQAQASALWAAGTFFLDEFERYPLAIINAPERACAKTLYQNVIGKMVRRPLQASNASASGLFRAVEKLRATLLLDEGDTFTKDKSELQGMINAGYAKGGFVLRSEASGDSYEPRTYSVFSAKSIAGIALENHLPDATMSRGIIFNMRRKLRHEKVERFRNTDEEFAAIRSKLMRASVDLAERVRSATPPLPEELNDREQDNWEPLLCIADSASGRWLEIGTAAALALTPKSVQGGASNELLRDVRDVLAGRHRINSVELVAELIHDEEKGWATYNRGKPITPRQLSKLLGVYGIGPKTVRTGSRTTKGYEHEQFDDAFRRYLDSTEPPTETPPTGPLLKPDDHPESAY
jgi:putative DNA primase/helicase